MCRRKIVHKHGAWRTRNSWTIATAWARMTIPKWPRVTWPMPARLLNTSTIIWSQQELCSKFPQEAEFYITRIREHHCMCWSKLKICYSKLLRKSHGTQFGLKMCTKPWLLSTKEPGSSCAKISSSTNVCDWSLTWLDGGKWSARENSSRGSAKLEKGLWNAFGSRYGEMKVGQSSTLNCKPQSDEQTGICPMKSKP